MLHTIQTCSTPLQVPCGFSQAVIEEQSASCCYLSIGLVPALRIMAPIFKALFFSDSTSKAPTPSLTSWTVVLLPVKSVALEAFLVPRYAYFHRAPVTSTFSSILNSSLCKSFNRDFPECMLSVNKAPFSLVLLIVNQGAALSFNPPSSERKAV